MISYIFKSKFKNILVTVLSVILILIGINDIDTCMMFENLSDAVKEFIRLIAYVLIFIYMITLKRKYKIKKWLFPIAFAVLGIATLFEIFECFTYTFLYYIELYAIFLKAFVLLLMFVGCVFCFIGTLSNFNKLKFLRLGLLFCIISVFIVNICLPFVFEISTNVLFSYLSFFENSIDSGLLLLFYISLFLLTLTRKSENIDITPFVEQRKAKKAAKKTEMLEQKVEEEILTDIPENSWRCMGCGEILPDSISECECGYKR